MSRAITAPLRLRDPATGRELHLTEGALLGRGGEARVYRHPHDPSQVVKVYHRATAESARKVAAMLAAPPEDPSRGHVSVAWPTGIVTDAAGRFAGFAMPRLDEDWLRVFEVYNPKTRRRKAPLFHWGYLHRAARNVAAAFAAVHARGYVVGDVNESNVLVSDEALVTLVDTDSFQVPDPAGGPPFRCPVGKPDFTPPELHATGFAEVDRTEVHDRFGLAVVLFHLLMEGTHPFTGRWMGVGEPPELAERIRRGWYPHGREGETPLLPARLSPSVDLLAPPLAALFHRAFAIGHAWPSARPDAAEWRDALDAAEASLVTCDINLQHRHADHLDACPWCARAAMLRGRDAFPSPDAIAKGEHLRGHRTPRAPRPSWKAPLLPQTARPRRGTVGPVASRTSPPGVRSVHAPVPVPYPAHLRRRAPRFLGSTVATRLNLRDAWDSLREASVPALATLILAVVGANFGSVRLYAWIAALAFAVPACWSAIAGWRQPGGPPGGKLLSLAAVVIVSALMTLYEDEAPRRPGPPIPVATGPLAIPLQSEIDSARARIGAALTTADAEAGAGRFWLAAEAITGGDGVLLDWDARRLDVAFLQAEEAALTAASERLFFQCSRGESDPVANGAIPAPLCPSSATDAQVAEGFAAGLGRADSLRLAGDPAAAADQLRETAAMARDLPRYLPDARSAREADAAAYAAVAARAAAACAGIACPPFPLQPIEPTPW